MAGMQRSITRRSRCPARALCTAAFLGASWLLPAAAAADVLSLYAAVQGGGAGGQGVDGEAQDQAFHEGVQGLAYGALVGAEVLFVDGWVEHTQHLRDGALAGTWTQFMIGLDTQIDIGSPETVAAPVAEPAPAPAVRQEPMAQEPNAGEPAGTAPGEPAGTEPGEPAGAEAAQAEPAAQPEPPPRPVAQQRTVVGRAPGYLDIGFAAGFGVGTGQQVMPPLDNSELTDKGFLGQVHLGLGYRISDSLSLGVRVPVQAGYLFKSGDGAAANDRGNQYVSVNASLLLELRLNLAIR